MRGSWLSVAAQEGREALVPRCVGDGREVVDAEAGPRLHRRLDHAQRQPSDEARHVEAVLPALTNPRPTRRAGERVVTHPRSAISRASPHHPAQVSLSRYYCPSHSPASAACGGANGCARPTFSTISSASCVRSANDESST